MDLNLLNKPLFERVKPPTFRATATEAELIAAVREFLAPADTSTDEDILTMMQFVLGQEQIQTNLQLVVNAATLLDETARARAAGVMMRVDIKDAKTRLKAAANPRALKIGHTEEFSE